MGLGAVSAGIGLAAILATLVVNYLAKRVVFRFSLTITYICATILLVTIAFQQKSSASIQITLLITFSFFLIAAM